MGLIGFDSSLLIQQKIIHRKHHVFQAFLLTFSSHQDQQYDNFCQNLFIAARFKLNSNQDELFNSMKFRITNIWPFLRQRFFLKIFYYFPSSIIIIQTYQYNQKSKSYKKIRQHVMQIYLDILKAILLSIVRITIFQFFCGAVNYLFINTKISYVEFIIIIKSIEQFIEKMTKQQKVLHKNKKSKDKNTETNSKFKSNTKIIKKQQKSSLSSTKDIQNNIYQSIMDFIQQKGDQYFVLSLEQLKKIIESDIKDNINLKRLLSEQINIFQVKQYKNSRQLIHKYINRLIVAQKSKILRIQLSTKQEIALCMNMLVKDNNTSDKNMIISRQQIQFLEKRKDFIKRIKNIALKSCQYKSNQIFSIQEQMCALFKIKKQKQYEILQILNSLNKKNSQQLLINDNQSEQQSIRNRQYIAFLINKNINKAISIKNIDLINYFIIKEFQDKHQDCQSFDKFISNQRQFSRFIEKNKFNSRKNKRLLLKTACAGCFSNYSEAYNPLNRCKKCGIRFHKLCNQSDKFCKNCKCENIKLQCIICLKRHSKGQGLLFKEISVGNQQKFAHTFCILAHNQWKLQNQQIKFHLNAFNNNKCCKICNKESIFAIKGLNNDDYHAMCAYLKGYELIRQNNIMYIKDDSQNNQRLQFERQYILNYEGLVYQKNVFQLILKHAS